MATIEIETARRPVEAVRPLTGREVAVAVRHARDEGHELALDLSGLKRIVIDPQQRTARLQAGATPDELQAAAGYWGLAALADRRGLEPANLLAAQVVLPDAELVDPGAELLHEIRTGRAAGIVVDATYRLHDAAELRR